MADLPRGDIDFRVEEGGTALVPTYLPFFPLANV